MSDGSQTAETIHNAGKAQLVDSLRLMGDNQRTLNATNNQDRRLRDLHIRNEEAEAKKRYPDLADPSPIREEPMDIRVDSPTTINHNYAKAPSLPEADDKPPAEPTLRKAVGTLGKVAIAAALVGSGAGVTGLAMWALDKLSTPPAVETPVDAGIEYEGRIKVK